jgi:hypothetical protein
MKWCCTKEVVFWNVNLFRWVNSSLVSRAPSAFTFRVKQSWSRSFEILLPSSSVKQSWSRRFEWPSAFVFMLSSPLPTFRKILVPSSCQAVLVPTVRWILIFRVKQSQSRRFERFQCLHLHIKHSSANVSKDPCAFTFRVQDWLPVWPA